MFDMEACGERIRSLRKNRNITQEAAAEALNCSAYHYRRVESGKEGASIDLLIDMAGYFGTSIDYLVLGRTGAAAAEKEELKKQMLMIARLITKVTEKF